jgi:hypothetical protein
MGIYFNRKATFKNSFRVASDLDSVGTELSRLPPRPAQHFAIRSLASRTGIHAMLLK